MFKIEAPFQISSAFYSRLVALGTPQASVVPFFLTEEVVNHLLHITVSSAPAAACKWALLMSVSFLEALKEGMIGSASSHHPDALNCLRPLTY